VPKDDTCLGTEDTPGKPVLIQGNPRRTKGIAMKKTHHDRWNDGASKDTFWNLAVLLCGVLHVIASAVDLPQAPGDIAHVAYGQTTAVR
jgi:hypothetical protein